ncbi:MAG: NAD(P)-dependent oxidoreductase [Firmicutes bacterium]|nr:NAD(P)-dependent oxidoreductase [Bacillota bacterium]
MRSVHLSKQLKRLKSSKIFITGAAGFIGSHITKFLVQQGYEIHALVRPDAGLHRIQRLLSSLHLIQANLEDQDKIKDELKKIKPDTAIHLAWTTNPEDYWKTTENLTLLQASINLAKNLADLGCKKLMITGTCFEYDTTLGILSETNAIKPKSLYAACKYALFSALEPFCKHQEIQFIWPRFFYLYGPFENEKRFVPKIIVSLLEGKQAVNPPGVLVRDYLHVEDAAKAAAELLKSDLTGPVNIGSGTPVYLKDLMEIIGEILKKKELIKFKNHPISLDDPILILGDNRKLTENTDWKPQYDLRTGLENTIQWWKKNGTS